MSTSILWTRPMLKRFKRAHAKAVKDELKEFTFDGHEFVTGYAGYLIEYLDSQFNQERTLDVSHNS